jgi:AbrB family looped-hinge helix DNA binding protein
MGTRVTIKGQVTIPKDVREALGIRAGDEVAFVVDRPGEARVRKVRDPQEHRRRLEAARRRKPIRGIATDDLMKLLRG